MRHGCFQGIAFLLLYFFTSLPLYANGWKDYLAYSEVQDVEKAGTLLYVQASDGLYVYNTNDKSITTYDKATGLSDTHVSLIKYNRTAQRLIIVYDDSNIDLLDANGTVTNISDLYNANLTTGKTVYSIYCQGRYAYLCTDFGIMKVDVSDALIADTYQLGIKVQWCTIADGYIHAQSKASGHYRALLTDNLLDKSVWSRVGAYQAQPAEDKSADIAVTKTLQPGGPKYNHFGKIKFKYGNLYTVGGGFAAGVEQQYPGTVQVLRSNDTWQIFPDTINKITGYAFLDNTDIDVDPTDTSRVLVAGRTGVYEFNRGRYVTTYNFNNTPLESAVTGNPAYTLVEGITFDNAGNLWLLNSGAENQSVVEMTNAGQWVSHHSSTFISNENNLSLFNMVSPMVDSRGILWFGNQHWYTPGLFALNTSTDAAKAVTIFYNEDGTSYTDVRVHEVAEDKDNNLWVCTTKGPFYLESSEMNNDTPIFNQIKVPRNDGTNLADYLLTGIDISCIAIDGAGRKWFGTNGQGAYLISEDNNTQVQHFTAANSGLLSDVVNSIAINGETGEVFFATTNGLCSWQSDATTPAEEMNKDKTYAYPNPVKPGYTGVITIVGLTYDADVKIVSSNGTLVNEGKSTGGRYEWDGNDQKGKAVASGIYMVETATETGEKGTVCKIAIVR
ncbi:MAG: two-component regulator propeller domain-containing protein [Prevotella sp.]|nr:two-component regulator propeller domain-containing protein [Prevotella sp.]